MSKELNTYLLKPVAALEALKERKSYGKFTKQFKDIRPEKAGDKFADAFMEFAVEVHQQVGNAETVAELSAGDAKKFKVLETLDALSKKLTEHGEALEEVAKLKDGVWVPRKGKDADDIAKLVEKFEKAEGKMLDYLRGEEVKGVKLPKDVTKAFVKFEEQVGAAEGVMNGWFGRARIDGFGKAAENSLKEMQFWSEKGKKTHGIGFAKCAVSAGGAGAIVHGVLAGKNSEGEERNGLVRLCEVIVGGGAIAGALAFGKAR